MSHRDQKIDLESASDARINPQPEFFVEESWVALDGARMRYLRAGSGPALLLVHGLLGYSFSWRFTIPALARHATVYAIDLLGTGFSDRPPGLDYSFKASAERLLRFMDATGLPACDLLGTSHGGAVSMRAAAIAPDRIRRLILVDPVNPWSAHGKRLTVFLSNPLIAPLFVALAPRLPMLHAYYHHRMFGDRQRIPADSLEGYLRPMRIPGSYDYPMGVVSSWNHDLEELESSAAAHQKHPNSADLGHGRHRGGSRFSRTVETAAQRLPTGNIRRSRPSSLRRSPRGFQSCRN